MSLASVSNLRAAVALHFGYYKFRRMHLTLRVTPAMEARITNHVRSVEELIAAAVEAYEAPQSPPPVIVREPPSRGATFGRRPVNNAPLPGQLPLPGVL